MFVGLSSSVAFGDYLTGANHVLPTGGLARAYSGLGPEDFVRWTSIQTVTPAAAARLAGDVALACRSRGIAGARERGAILGDDMTERAFEPRAGYRDLAVYRNDAVPVEVDLGDNTNLFGTAPSALAVVREWAGDPSQYPTLTTTGLREAIADWLGVRATQVLPGCGSNDLIDSTMRAFGDPGTEVAFAAPTFVMTAHFAAANSLRPRPVPVRSDFQPDVGALLATEAPLLYLATPNNPGATLTRPELLDRLLDRAPGLVMLDEAYAEFAGVSRVGEAAARGNLLVMRTFSKAWGLAGLRIGYAVGSDRLIEELEKARGPYKVNAVAERAATAAVGRDRDWLAGVVDGCGRSGPASWIGSAGSATHRSIRRRISSGCRCPMPRPRPGSWPRRASASEPSGTCPTSAISSGSPSDRRRSWTGWPTRSPSSADEDHDLRLRRREPPLPGQGAEHGGHPAGGRDRSAPGASRPISWCCPGSARSRRPPGGSRRGARRCVGRSGRAFPASAYVSGCSSCSSGATEGPGEGLGVLPGRVTRLDAQPAAADRVERGGQRRPGCSPAPPSGGAYYANSYVCRPPDDRRWWWRGASTRATASPRRFARRRTLGVQFHPEKSSGAGAGADPGLSGGGRPMIAIPAIDLRDGACVQLVGGDYARGADAARRSGRGGARVGAIGFARLHVVDLDAATGRGDNAALGATPSAGLGGTRSRWVAGIADDGAGVGRSSARGGLGWWWGRERSRTPTGSRSSRPVTRDGSWSPPTCATGGW